MSDINGVLNLIKPIGLTSFQTVKNIKKILGADKAGHTGTLDTLATGVLPVCLGKATKIIPYLNENIKEYIAEIELGKTTETLDREGKIIKNNDKWKMLSKSDIIEVINSFKGQLKQIPPMYSAVHHKGKRLYKLARQGKEIERKPRNIVIYSLDILQINLPFIKLQINCSKGTYIRALARDIGKQLNVGAFLTFLIRTRSGPFFIQKAHTVKEVKNNINSSEKIIQPLDYYLAYPSRQIKKKAFKKAINGMYLTKGDLLTGIEEFNYGDLILIYGPEKQFISINKYDLKDKQIILQPERVFI